MTHDQGRDAAEANICGFPTAVKATEAATATAMATAEERLFSVLGEVYALRPGAAVDLAAFAAGQIAAYLADVACVGACAATAAQAAGRLRALRDAADELLADLSLHGATART